MKKTIGIFALLPVLSGLVAIAQPPQGAQPGEGRGRQSRLTALRQWRISSLRR